MEKTEKLIGTKHWIDKQRNEKQNGYYWKKLIRMKLLRAHASHTTIPCTAQKCSANALFKIYTHVSHHLKTHTTLFRYFSVPARHRSPYSNTTKSTPQYQSWNIITTYTCRPDILLCSNFLTKSYGIFFCINAIL